MSARRPPAEAPMAINSQFGVFADLRWLVLTGTASYRVELYSPDTENKRSAQLTRFARRWLTRSRASSISRLE